MLLQLQARSDDSHWYLHSS